MTASELIKPNAKAIAAFVVTAVVTWAAGRGIDIPEWAQILIAGAVVAVVVWFTRNAPKVVKTIGEIREGMK